MADERGPTAGDRGLMTGDCELATNDCGPTESGVVVAGGRSRRFGDRDKALAPVAGRSMLARVCDALAPAVDELVVNCRAEQADSVRAHLAGRSLPTTVAVDPVPDRGPLAGVATGLAAATGGRAVVASCDLPRLASAVPQALLDRCAVAARPAVPRVDGHRQPLCAAYPTERTRRACEALLAADERALGALLDRLDPVTVPAAALPAAGTVESVDTPAAARRAERLLAERAGGRPAAGD